MNWDRIEGNWMQMKGKVKEQWGDLTDDDLDRINGPAGSTRGGDPETLRDGQGSGSQGR